MEKPQLKSIGIASIELNAGQIEGLPQNPRFIRDERYEKLLQSVKDAPEMLDMRSLIVAQHDGKYVVVCGNMRLRACRELGYETLPCYVLPEDTPAAKLREYTIKDNIGFGETDWEMLANEWDAMELDTWGLDTENWGITPDDCTEEFELPDGEKGLAQMTFILSNEQSDFIKGCLPPAKRDLGDLETFGNKNGNGNALYKIVKEWAEQKR